MQHTKTDPTAHSPHGLLATRRPIDFRRMTWLNFKEGVIVEGWEL